MHLDATRVFVEMYATNNPFPPTVREVMDACGFRSTATAWRYLNRLVELGQLIRVEGEGSYRGFTIPGHMSVYDGVLDMQYPDMTLEDWEGIFDNTKRELLKYYPDDHPARNILINRLRDPREVESVARDVVDRATEFERAFGKPNAGIKKKRR